jgi:hypothetical protein
MTLPFSLLDDMREVAVLTRRSLSGACREAFEENVERHKRAEGYPA